MEVQSNALIYGTNPVIACVTQCVGSAMHAMRLAKPHQVDNLPGT